jgi:hypothetical protein
MVKDYGCLDSNAMELGETTQPKRLCKYCKKYFVFVLRLFHRKHQFLVMTSPDKEAVSG